MQISATLEDYPPLVLATLGGFLQQLFGARRLLQVDNKPARLTERLWQCLQDKPAYLIVIRETLSRLPLSPPSSHGWSSLPILNHSPASFFPGISPFPLVKNLLKSLKDTKDKLMCLSSLKNRKTSPKSKKKPANMKMSLVSHCYCIVIIVFVFQNKKQEGI